MATFLVLSLPRSRSKWLSTLLSPPGRSCGHDLLVQSVSLGDFERKLAMVDGSCETGAVVGWRLLLERLPAAVIITIHREVSEVSESVRRKGWQVDEKVLHERAGMLEELACHSRVLSFDYEELRSEAACREIFEKCLPGEAWSHERWLRLANQNIQIDFGARMLELAIAGPQLAAMMQEVASATRGLKCLN